MVHAGQGLVIALVRGMLERHRFLRFVLVGGLNTAIGYGIYFCGLVLGLDPAIALAIATALGAFVNFLTTGRLVFASKDHTRLPRFLAVYGVTYLINYALLRFAMALGAPAWLAQAIVLPIVILATYVNMSLWVFRQSDDVSKTH